LSRPNRAGPNDQAEAAIDYAALSDEDLGMVRASAIEVCPVRWLLRYRLAAGTMAMLAGDGGLGKSQVALAIAALISTGGDWFDRSGPAPLGDILILSAEDNPKDTIKPRLIALGADLDRVTILRARVVISRAGKEPLIHPMSFQDRAYWRMVFDRRPHCRLFVVDPLPSYLGRGINDSRNNEIRGVLEPFLTEIIELRDLCMLAVSHLSKAVDTRTPMHRIVGSIAYGNLPRNVHFVVRDPDDPSRRFFKQAKCNNAPDDLPALAFRVERREIPCGEGQVIETAVPAFEPEPVRIDLHELVSGKPQARDSEDDTAQAAEWLASRLAEGPVGSVLCAREGERALGRIWPDAHLPLAERHRAILGRVKWWRERVLKTKLGGYSRKAPLFQGPYLFVLPDHEPRQRWPPPPEAIAARWAEEKEGLPKEANDAKEVETLVGENAPWVVTGSASVAPRPNSPPPASLASLGGSDGFFGAGAGPWGRRGRPRAGVGAMTLTELDHLLRARGIKLSLRLGVKGPRSALTPEVVAALATHKPALLARLAGLEGPDPAPPVAAPARPAAAPEAPSPLKGPRRTPWGTWVSSAPDALPIEAFGPPPP
jgi:putative DNA primase/helicase